MSSVGSSIAQRPYRGKNFTVTSASAIAYPTSSIEATTFTTTGGAAQITGNVIVFQTNTDATAAASGNILFGGAALSAVAPALGVGGQLRDMGRYVTVYVGGVKVYTLALVQNMIAANPGSTEGVGGNAPTSGLSEGYNTFYVAVENDNGGAYVGSGSAGTASAGVGVVGVARVF